MLSYENKVIDYYIRDDAESVDDNKKHFIFSG